jgi:hypothetical protein
MRFRLTAGATRASRRPLPHSAAVATVVGITFLACGAPESPADLARARKVSAPRISEPRPPAVRTAGPTRGDTSTGAEHKTRKLNPQDAILIVEQSGLQFVAPLRKNKEKVYDAHKFADMLRTKWDWLGADIEDLDDFIDQIASDAFATFEPYRVRHRDGREQDFSGWLRARLKERRAALAAENGNAVAQGAD